MKRILLALLIVGLAFTAAGQDKPPIQFDKIVLENLDGIKVKYKDIASQVTVIVMWATWCAPCIEELPYADALFEHYRKDKRVSVLALNVNAGSSSDKDLMGTIKDKVKRLQLKMPVLRDPQMDLSNVLSPGSKPNKKAGAKIASSELPLLAIVNAQGQVYRSFGFNPTVSKKEYVQQKKKIIDAAIEGRPPETKQLIPMVYTLMLSGKTDQAVEMLQNALAQNPTDKNLLSILADVYKRNAQLDKTIPILQKILALEPESAAAMNALGYNLALRGENLEKAERLVRQALAKEPKSGDFMDSLGWVQYQKGDYQDALKTLQEAYKLAPYKQDILAHLAETQLKLGQCQAAVEQYRKAFQAVQERQIILPVH